MADYPCTTVTGKIKSLLLKIREVGVPPTATVKWLKSIGFTSSNDGTLLPLLKYIGFTDTSKVPTSVWKKYRGANHGQLLASAIRQGYSDLFAVYPDANVRAASEIEHVISTSVSAGKQTITKTVRTFQNLCKEADFSALGEVAAPPLPKNDPTPNTTNSGAASPLSGDGTSTPSLHIDIQVHISPDSTPEQIDKIFESMAKHLYKKNK